MLLWLSSSAHVVLYECIYEWKQNNIVNIDNFTKNPNINGLGWCFPEHPIQEEKIFLAALINKIAQNHSQFKRMHKIKEIISPLLIKVTWKIKACNSWENYIHFCAKMRAWQKISLAQVITTTISTGTSKLILNCNKIQSSCCPYILLQKLGMNTRFMKLNYNTMRNCKLKCNF